MNKLLVACFICTQSLVAWASNAVFASSTNEELLACSRICSPDCRRLTQQTERIVRRVNSACGFDGDNGDHRPLPPPHHNSSFELYHSDTCSTGYMGKVDARTRCENFASSSDAWGIKFNGRCINISDMSAVTACYAFSSLSERSVQLYHSDTCSGSLVAAVDFATDCEQLSQRVRTDIWGIQVNGRCINIQDTTFANACRIYQRETVR